MPELPEVETIKLGLQKYLIGHKIEKVDVNLPRIVSGDTSWVLGAKIVSIERFGKGLIINLDNSYSIAIHIKMTGQLIYRNQEAGITNQGKKESVPSKFTHVIFYLSSDGNGKGESVKRKELEKNFTQNVPPLTLVKPSAFLYYNDIRQFGWIKIVKTSEVHSLPFFKELGLEPPVIDSRVSAKGGLSRGNDKKVLDLKTFSLILKKKKTAIKPLIMDQKIIAGIGNIYANDALFLAKILPSRPANSLSDEKIEKLFDAIIKVLKKGLEVGGASEWQYVNALGEAGGYQNFFQVYGKVGKPCPNCGSTIQRTMLGGRGTFFCPACQR